MPCWHIFERTAEYYCLSRGTTLIYTNLRNFKTDLIKYKPNYLIAVPRLYETLYKGIMSQIKQQSLFKQKLINLFLSITKFYKQNLQLFYNNIIINNNIYIKKKLNPLNKLISLVKRFSFTHNDEFYMLLLTYYE